MDVLHPVMVLVNKSNNNKKQWYFYYSALLHLATKHCTKSWIVLWLSRLCHEFYITLKFFYTAAKEVLFSATPRLSTNTFRFFLTNQEKHKQENEHEDTSRNLLVKRNEISKVISRKDSRFSTPSASGRKEVFIEKIKIKYHRFIFTWRTTFHLYFHEYH